MKTVSLSRSTDPIRVFATFLAILLGTALCEPAAARQAAGDRPTADRTAAAIITADDYARAEALLGWNVPGLVTGADVSPRWIAGDGRERFWYRNRIAAEFEFIVIDPAAATRQRAFDHPRLASAPCKLAQPDRDLFLDPSTESTHTR